MADLPSSSRLPPRPFRIGAINRDALPRLNALPPAQQFQTVIGELLQLSVRDRRSMRIALGCWMRQALRSADPELIGELPATPAEEASAARAYWRHWYNSHREGVNARRRERRRQHKTFPGADQHVVEGRCGWVVN